MTEEEINDLKDMMANFGKPKQQKTNIIVEKEESPSEEIIYNTLADIHSKPWVGTVLNLEDGKISEYIEDPTQVVKSLDGCLINKGGNYYIPKHLGGKDEIPDYKLSDFIDKVPHGIFDKSVTGIGATTIEILAERHSIIVMPTKNLANSKAIQHNHTLYVGSDIGEQKDSYNKIEEYAKNSSNKFQKYLVVADSLPLLLEKLQSLNIFKDLYREVFFMVDEIDLLQEDSNYRPVLEDVIDYYFMFGVKNRSLVSATLKEFSNPLFKNECVFKIDNVFKNNRSVDIIHTNDIKQQIINIINNTPQDEKILFAYNDIKQITNIFNSLDVELQRECSILCSEQNVTNDYYNTLLDNKLPTRIVSMTSTYFAGIDIYDNYHLITISNIQSIYQLLSIEKIVQIYGRCRLPNRILSDTIIYQGRKEVYEELNYNRTNYKNRLIKKANRVIDLYNASYDISKDDEDLKDLFNIINHTIAKYATEKIGETMSLQLTRKNIFDEYVTAYFNIDHLIERKTLLYNTYKDKKTFIEALSDYNIIVNSYNYAVVEDDAKSNIKQNTAKKDEETAKLLQTLETVGTDIMNLIQKNELNESNLRALKRKTNEDKVKLFIDRFVKLYKYVDPYKLLSELHRIAPQDSRLFKTLNNRIIFNALVDNHPFKISINEAFQYGVLQSSDEIIKSINQIFEYHRFQTLKDNTAIFFYKSLFDTKRGSYNNYSRINNERYTLFSDDAERIDHTNRFPEFIF